MLVSLAPASHLKLFGLVKCDKLESHSLSDVAQMTWLGPTYIYQ